MSLKDGVFAAFKNLRSLYPTSRIMITGHSLGGALATLFIPEIFELNNNKPIDGFYTFG